MGVGRLGELRGLTPQKRSRLGFDSADSTLPATNGETENGKSEHGTAQTKTVEHAKKPEGEIWGVSG